MSRFTIIVLLGSVAFLTACGSSPTRVAGPKQIPTRLDVDKAPVGDVVIGMPITLPGSDHAMLPVTLEHLKAWFEPDPSYGQTAGDTMEYGLSRSSFYRNDVMNRYVHWHNVIFHDQTTDDTRLLLDHTAFISQYQLLGKSPEKEDETFRADCLIFSISDTDTNADGVIDPRDAVVAYACDINGQNLRPITPQGTKLLHLNYLPDHKLVYLVVIQDTTGDGQFTTHDKRQLLRYRVSDNGPGQPVIEDEAVNRIKQILKAD